MKNAEIYKKITNDIIKLMEAGEIPWHKPWQGSVNLPRNGVSRKVYSGTNLYLMFLPYGSKDFFTFSQIQELGGHIKKGESGHYVVYWKMFTPKVKDEEIQEEIAPIPFLKHYVVWNREQIEGLPEPEEIPVKIDPLEEGEKILQGYKDCPEISFGGDKACYAPAFDRIFCPVRDAFEGAGEYYSTLFHECIHSTGSKSRLGRLPEDFTFGDADYSKEELVAELGASFLCGIAGIDNSETRKNSAAYLQNWMKRLKEDSALFFNASRLAGKAVDYILGKQEKAL